MDQEEQGNFNYKKIISIAVFVILIIGLAVFYVIKYFSQKPRVEPVKPKIEVDQEIKRLPDYTGNNQANDDSSDNSKKQLERMHLCLDT